jgi:hypothetical protein
VFANGLVNKPTIWVFALYLLVFLFQYAKTFYNQKEAALSRKFSSPEFLIVFYFFLSFGLATLSSRRVGANINYYLEASLIAAVFFGIIFEYFRDYFKPQFALVAIVCMTLGGCAQLASVLNGEYYRWKAYDYYQEMSDRVAELTPSNSKCISIYPELMLKSNCEFYFDDYSEYLVGWSPELNEVFEREVSSGCFKTIVWNNDGLAEKFPNYQLVPMVHSPPEKFYKAYLYVQEPTVGGSLCQMQ